MNKNQNSSNDEIRGISLRSDAAGNAGVEGLEQAVIRQLSQTYVSWLKNTHFKGANLRAIIEEHFMIPLKGRDWEAYLWKNMDDRMLGNLITAYYMLIECSILISNSELSDSDCELSGETRPEKEGVDKCLSYTIETLRQIVQGVIRAPEHSYEDSVDDLECSALDGRGVTSG
jgi:hypothetical protein